jgi:hypothetical protein
MLAAAAVAGALTILPVVIFFKQIEVLAVLVGAAEVVIMFRHIKLVKLFSQQYGMAGTTGVLITVAVVAVVYSRLQYLIVVETVAAVVLAI